MSICLEKLAESTTHDLSNRKINLSLEEKIKRTKSFARMVKKFEEKRGVKCLQAYFEGTLLPHYITVKSITLSKMFMWLFNNWVSYNKPFPEIPDFEKARKETSNHSPDTFTKYREYEYSSEEISKAFSEAKRSLPTKSINEVRKHSQVALMAARKASGEVYDVENGKWVKKGSKISGHVIDPEVEIKKVESKDERMKV